MVMLMLTIIGFVVLGAVVGIARLLNKQPAEGAQAFIWLWLVAFIPFPTALMGEYAGNRLAVSFFGCVFAVNTLLFIALHAYILRRLAKPELAPMEVPHIVGKSFVGVGSYLLGAVVAWFSIPAAFVIYLITPLFFITPPHRRQVSA